MNCPTVTPARLAPLGGILRPGVATFALLLAASPLLAESGAGLTDWALIPAVAAAAGSAGTYWRSDVQILNPDTTRSIVVRVADLVSGEDNSIPYFRDYSIPPAAQIDLADVVDRELGRGGTGALVLSTADGSGFIATSRTYNTGSFGTYGQTESGQSFVCREGELALIPAVRNAGGFRSNVGIVNASDSSATFYVDAFDTWGAFGGSTTLFLPPWSQLQVAVASFSASFSLGYLEVSSAPTASPLYWVAYASVIDNASGDAVFIESRLADWVASCSTSSGANRDASPGQPPGADFLHSSPSSGIRRVLPTDRTPPPTP